MPAREHSPNVRHKLGDGLGDGVPSLFVLRARLNLSTGGHHDLDGVRARDHWLADHARVARSPCGDRLHDLAGVTMTKHPIPDAALEQHTAILGKTGSGK